MADPTVIKNLIIHIGDGGDPTETFAFLCGANAWGIEFSNKIEEYETLDCADPTGTPAAINRYFRSADTKLNISGYIAEENLAMLVAWSESVDPTNVRLVFAVPAPIGGYFQLPAFIESLKIDKGEPGKPAEFEAQLLGAARRTWVPAT